MATVGLHNASAGVMNGQQPMSLSILGPGRGDVDREALAKLASYILQLLHSPFSIQMPRNGLGT